MKAIVLTGFGTPDHLHLQELPTPQPRAAEVLVAVARALDMDERSNQWLRKAG
jgi:NADPH:quinone reductase-like Zn-dependent oxidoreductase